MKWSAILCALATVVGCDAGRVAVTGYVRNPGSYPHRAGASPGFYVEAAGGYVEGADTASAYLIRAPVAVDGVVDHAAMEHLAFAQADTVRPGDTVNVPPVIHAISFDRAWTVSDFRMAVDDVTYTVETGQMVVGRIGRGAVVAVLLGRGEATRPEAGEDRSPFHYVYLRCHPDLFDAKVRDQLGDPVTRPEPLEDAVEIHRALHSRIGFETEHGVALPREGAMRALAGYYMAPKSEDYPGRGMRQRTYPDGRVWTTFDDGRQRWIHPDGKVTVDYADGGRTVRHADGRGVRTWPDGRKETRWADGRVVMVMPSGTETETAPDGRKTLRYHHGQVQVVLPDGTRELRLPNGMAFVSHADGRESVVYPDGRREISFPDGHAELHLPDGEIQRFAKPSATVPELPVIDLPESSLFDLAELDTGREADYLSEAERNVILEINKARVEPRLYAFGVLAPALKRYRGRKLTTPTGTVTTLEGPEAAVDLYNYLMRAEPIDPLSPSRGLTRAAADQVTEQGQTGGMSHDGRDGSTPTTRMLRHGSYTGAAAENLAYGPEDPVWIVLQLMIDDGVVARDHRRGLMDARFRRVGVAIGPHPTARNVCAITLAGAFYEAP